MDTALTHLLFRIFRPSLISNNCWSSFTYQRYRIPYYSPFAGLLIHEPDYIELLENFEDYIRKELVFIQPEQSKYSTWLKDEGLLNTYPIARIENIEIHFMNYHDNESARSQWSRRVARINKNCLIVKLSQREYCTDELIERFCNLPFKKKICFVENTEVQHPCIRRISPWILDDGNEWPMLWNQMNFFRWCKVLLK